MLVTLKFNFKFHFLLLWLCPDNFVVSALDWLTSYLAQSSSIGTACWHTECIPLRNVTYTCRLGSCVACVVSSPRPVRTGCCNVWLALWSGLPPLLPPQASLSCCLPACAHCSLLCPSSPLLLPPPSRPCPRDASFHGGVRVLCCYPPSPPASGLAGPGPPGDAGFHCHPESAVLFTHCESTIPTYSQCLTPLLQLTPSFMYSRELPSKTCFT